MMRINEVNIPKEFEDNGLEDIKMQRLNQIVVLVGKNGAGKTRFLSKLSSAIKVWKTKEQADQTNYKLNRRVQDVIDNQIAGTPEILWKNIKDEIEILKLEINKHLLLKAEHKLQAIDYVPKNVWLNNPEIQNSQTIKSNAKGTKNPGVGQLANAILLDIQNAQNLFYETKRTDWEENDEEKHIAEKDYSNLKSLIKALLKTDIGRDKEGNAKLFGRKIGDAKLSEGQSILLQLAMAIYRQAEFIGNYILLMDEPENHMHPSAIIDALKEIIEATKESQIWIATHSLPIIAYLASLQETSIYYVEDGEVSFAGSTPEKVLEGLLGDEEQIGKLHDFIGLPAQYAINLYAYQCLFEPAVAETGADDPQTNQIKKILDDFAKEKSLKILDYGAGKGRLLANILETDTELLKKTDYVAYDTFTANKDKCEGVINTVYGDETGKRYFNSMSNLKSVHKNSFDVVLLCNVLHEIPPKDWIGLFKNDIDNLLNENGVVLIVEDSQIPIGEKAHQHGFIVFDEAQIRELFDIGGAEDFVSQPHPKNQRLKAHLVLKKYLSNISDKTRKEAIKSLNEKAKEEIERLRLIQPQKITFKQGREHAFWVQQFANTQLALDAM